MTTTSSALAATDLGALLAQHPLGWWMAGAVAFALLGSAALTGLRSLRQHVGAPLGRVFPPQARWVLVAAMAASACTLVLAGATLAELAESGSAQGYWGALDDALAASLQAQASAAVLQWFATLTHLGDTWVLTALAVGFSVSIAQYLPTLWLGAGRIPTLTSQAVALSSGGEAQTLAAQALWQLLLPAVCFTLTALLAWLAGRYRRGLR